MKRRGHILVVSLLFLLVVLYARNLMAGQVAVTQPSKTEIMQMTKKLHMPFISNTGQVDERVKFYANTFGGTVFITKAGAIVYALANNSSESGVETLEGKKTEDRRQKTEDRRQYRTSSIMYRGS